MKIEIEDIDLIEISSIFTFELQEKVAEILRENNLQEHLVDFFKSETHYHTSRVQIFSMEIAKDLGLSEKEIREVCEIAPFHDFGKLLTPSEVLNKPSSLTPEEFEIIKEHPRKGFDLLNNQDNDLLDLAAVVAHEHHEHYDGKGYPSGLKGEEIHIYSRIVAVADVLDSLLSPRVYKSPWSNDKVRDFFEARGGKQFDPEIIDILMNDFDKYAKLHEKIYCSI